MAQSPESRLTRRIIKALREEYPGSFWFKVWGGPFQQAGLPDIIGCANGRFVGLEVKVDVHRYGVTPLQQATLDAISAAGGIAAVVTSPEEALWAVAHG